MRVQDVPEAQQVTWIVDRAVARRHLTLTQKQALNALLREQVLDVMEDRKTGAEKRIGLGQSQRADMLGVTRQTVRRWDVEEDKEESRPVTNVAGQPTHFVPPGRPDTTLPIHPAKTKKERKSKPLTKGRRPGTLMPRPKWLSMFFNWSNRPLPEYRPTLIEMQERIDKALATIDMDGA